MASRIRTGTKFLQHKLLWIRLHPSPRHEQRTHTATTASPHLDYPVCTLQTEDNDGLDYKRDTSLKIYCPSSHWQNHIASHSQDNRINYIPKDTTYLLSATIWKLMEQHCNTHLHDLSQIDGANFWTQRQTSLCNLKYWIFLIVIRVVDKPEGPWFPNTSLKTKNIIKIIKCEMPALHFYQSIIKCTILPNHQLWLSLHIRYPFTHTHTHTHTHLLLGI